MFDESSVFSDLLQAGDALVGKRRRVLVVIGAESALRERLRIERYEVLALRREEKAIEAITEAQAGCVIIDLAGLRNFDLCRELRARGSDVPILLITRRNRAMDGVNGLRLGADDFVRRPLDVEELLARIEALLRRSVRMPRTASRLEVNFRTAEVARDGHPVALSALELQLLRYLMEHRGEVLTRDELLEKVWGHGALPVTRTVDVRIASLRRKLEANPARPELIVTIHGVGYKLVA